MKILVTGSNGFVAGSILAGARRRHVISGVARREPELRLDGVQYHLLDLCDQAGLAGLLQAIKPDAVIHTAALAGIDFCENNRAMAEQINVGVTHALANLCREAGIRLIHCSTDTVFDGRRGNYTESDPPNPVNFYAETKARAETIVLSASKENIVARLALVIGLPVIGKGNSFLSDLLRKLERREPVVSFQNEIRTPVDVVTAGAALTELAEITHFNGLIHLAGNTRIDRFAMGKEIAVLTGASPELITAADSNAVPGRAQRPADASLDNSLARRTLKTRMLSLRDGLTETLQMKRP